MPGKSGRSRSSRRAAGPRATDATLGIEGVDTAARLHLSRPPEPRFMPVADESSGDRAVYELRDRRDETKLWAWPLARIVRLTEQLRDAAAARLRDVFPDQIAAIERTLIGRKADGRDATPAGQRVRIVPLPSIGHEHMDHAIRRVAIDVPADCALRASDVQWAFTGLELMGQAPDELGAFVLTPTQERGMLGPYGSERAARHWRSVTAVALPAPAIRTRIEPSRRREEAQGASERIGEEVRTMDAVRAAIRHAGARAKAVAVRVQREPFEARGVRAEMFAEGTRFPEERLWHVELELREPVEGPFLIGDGRFLGLGLMAPALETAGIFGFAIDGAATAIDGDGLVRAMRRAVMARVQAELGARPLGPFFSGHDDNGEPVRSERSSHIAVQWDPTRGRLLVIAPHLLDHRQPTANERYNLEVLDRAMDGFSELRAGRAGYFRLSCCAASETDEYLGGSRTWVSVRPYTVTRHRKASSPAEVLEEDVIAECARRELPRPTVTVLGARGVPGRGLEGKLRLDFAVAVAGPLVLGRTRYLGGGLFGAMPPRASQG